MRVELAVEQPPQPRAPQQLRRAPGIRAAIAYVARSESQANSRFGQVAEAGRGEGGGRGDVAAARELERDDAAERVAGDVRALQARAVDERRDRVGELLDAARPVRDRRRAAEARQVHAPDVALGREEVDHRRPRRPVHADAREQHAAPARGRREGGGAPALRRSVTVPGRSSRSPGCSTCAVASGAWTASARTNVSGSPRLPATPSKWHGTTAPTPAAAASSAASSASRLPHRSSASRSGSRPLIGRIA